METEEMKLYNPEDITIQTFDDSEERKAKNASLKTLAQIFPYKANGSKERIKELQSKGAGIYMTTNPQDDGFSRGVEHTKRFQYLTLDLDVAKEKAHLTKDELEAAKLKLFDELKTLSLPPYGVMFTKNGLQPGWKFADPHELESKEERIKANGKYQSMVKAVTQVLGHKSEGDSICRVIRLPESLHLKTPNDPYKIVYQEISGHECTFEEFNKAYPAIASDSDSSLKGMFDWNQAINITEGSRDQTIFRAADSLAAKGFDFETALTILRGANTTYKPPLGDSIVVEKLKNAFNFIESRKTEESSIYNASFLSTVPKLITELTSDQAKVDWIWEGYLARGHLTFFSALWKVGKSTLIAYLLKALQEGKEFAGQPVTPTKVLILSEESETIWARRREDLGLTGDIYVHCRPTKLKLDHKQWLTLLELEEKFCTEKGINLFIIDTISTFWPTRDEGNNPEIDAALIPLNVFYEKDICVMTVHHFRKSGGDQGTATRGGGGIGSRADILIECSRLDAENPNDTQRVLRTYSRFEESPPELVVELVGDEYLPRGTRSEVSKEAKLQIVLHTLQGQGDLTVNEILDNWDTESKKPVPRTIRNYMESLLQDGRVIQSGKKLVGKTEAPSYSLNNGGKESNTYTRDSSVIAPNESIQDSQEVKPEKNGKGFIDQLKMEYKKDEELKKLADWKEKAKLSEEAKQ